MNLQRVICAVYGVAVVALTTFVVAGEPLDELDVHQLELSPARYLDRELRVVGRFASAGAGKMRLMGSKIEFRLGPEIHLFANPQHVELVGRLEDLGGKLVFNTQRLTKIPSESQRFEDRKKMLTQVNYPALYQLSDWALQRAQWYNDSHLEQQAQDAWVQAFRWEEDDIARRGLADELLALADRGQQHEIAPSELARMRYRALLLKVQKLQPGDSAQRISLAENVSELLPGGDRPPRSPTQDSEQDQSKWWIQYIQSDESEREAMHRALYRSLVRDALLIESNRIESDLASLVRQAQEMVPEDTRLIRELERLELERRAQALATLSRRDALTLFSQFERLDFHDRAKELKSSWLAGRRLALDRAEIEDRVALARDYWQLLHEAETAEALLRESLSIGPSPDAEAALSELGFVKIGQNWRRPMDSQPLTPVADGDVVVGSSEQLVIQRLGAPDAVARTVGAGWMLELWRYEGPPQLFVYLRRIAATGKAAVVKIVAP